MHLPCQSLEECAASRTWSSEDNEQLAALHQAIEVAQDLPGLFLAGIEELAKSQWRREHAADIGLDVQRRTGPTDIDTIEDDSDAHEFDAFVVGHSQRQ